MDFEVRQTKRDCHCKVCDRLIRHNTEKMIYFKSIRGHSDPIHICFSCIKEMNEEVEKSEKEV